MENNGITASFNLRESQELESKSPISDATSDEESSETVDIPANITPKEKTINPQVTITLIYEGDKRISKAFEREVFVESVRKSDINEIVIRTRDFVDSEEMQNDKKVFLFLQTTITQNSTVFAKSSGYAFHTETGIQLLYLSQLDIPRLTLEYLKENISICTSTDKLRQYVIRYPWYLDASRRAVTLSHVSTKGLAKHVVQFMGALCRCDPALAFALCPTTIHDDVLTSAKYAPYFSCNPANMTDGFAQYQSEYTSILTPECIKGWVKNGGNRTGEVSIVNARERFATFTKVIFEPTTWEGQETGAPKPEFPWHHSEFSNTGCIVAGGLIGALFYDETRWLEVAKTTDVDLFVYAPDAEHAKSMALHLARYFKSIGAKFEYFHSVIRVILQGAPDIQIICPQSQTPLGVLVNFDFSSIQIAYQGEFTSANKITVSRFICTPAYAYFTPRGKSLLTRYNIRFLRLKKIMDRGFIPVTGERGYYLFPSRIFCSSVWKISLEQATPRSQDWIVTRAKNLFLRARHLSLQKLIQDGTKTKTGKLIKTLEDFDMNHGPWAKTKIIERVVTQAKEEAESYNYQYSFVVLLKDETGEIKRFPFTTRKQNMRWVSCTLENLETEFKPGGSTFKLGFDIYTEGINKTLAMPEDGLASSYGLDHVLLRNVKIFQGESIYNLAAPLEKPLNVHHTAFNNFIDKYPNNISYAPDKEPVRKIEGLFLFESVETLATRKEQYKLEWKQQRVQSKIDHEKYMRKNEERQAVAKSKQEEDLKKLKEFSEKMSDQGMGITPGQPIDQPTGKSSLPTPLFVPGGSSGDQPASASVVQKLIDQAMARNEAKKKEVTMSPFSLPPPIRASANVAVSMHNVLAKAAATSELEDVDVEDASVEEVGSPRMPQPGAQLPALMKQPRVISCHALDQNGKSDDEIFEEYYKAGYANRRVFLSELKPNDLHRYVEESPKIKTIQMWELPAMLTAFQKGEVYVPEGQPSRNAIKRSEQMVKVVAVVSFNPCMVFDVDDHLRQHSTVDDFPNKFYNAVIHFKNMDQWVVQPHAHRNVTSCAHNRPVLMRLLLEELESKCKSKPLKLSSALRSIRDIANSEKFELKVAKAICPLPHAHKGLLGEMPIVTCSRLYVSKTE